LCSSPVIVGQGRALGEVARLAREPPGNWKVDGWFHPDAMVE